MRVVVTGGAGFIGHHLVRELLARGARVAVIDNLSRGTFERAELAGAELIVGEVSNAPLCRSVLEGADAVVHLAAQSQVMSSELDPQYTFQANVEGAWTVASEARCAGVRHVVFASSREVYGNPQRLPVPETAPLAPHNLYGASKVAAEVLLMRMPGIPVSVLRLSNVIGAGDGGRVVPRWIEAARSGTPLTVFGGAQVLDLIPVEVAVAGFLRLLDRGPISNPINIGSGVQTPILQLARRILEMTDSTSRVICAPAREAEVDRFCADTRRMREVLQLEPPRDPVASIAEWWQRG